MKATILIGYLNQGHEESQRRGKDNKWDVSRININKSKEDEYLLYILVMSLPSNEIAKSQFLTKVRRAIERRPKLFDRLLIQRQNVVAHDTVNNIWYKTIAIKPEERRLVAVFTCIAKALYFHEKKQPWLGSVSVLTEFMLSLTNITQNKRQTAIVNELNTMLACVPRKGANPDIFSYQFAEYKGRIFTRFHFFGNNKVSAVYIP